MKKIVNVSLSGHPTLFQTEEAAYEVLRQYLERARVRLKSDPDLEEVIRDLEQSIGEKLAAVVDSGVVGVGDVKAVLEEVGAVGADSGIGLSDPPDEQPQARRRLYRIKEGQQIAGVCQGLSAYSSVRVDWVRLVFLLVAASTAGVGALVYIVMMFALPLVSTHKDYLAVNQPKPNRI